MDTGVSWGEGPFPNLEEALMADVIRKVDYYYVTVPDRPGKGARVLAALSEAGVNLLAFHAFPTDQHSQLDLVPQDPKHFEEAAQKAGLDLSPRRAAFLLEGDDRPGVVAELLERLGEAGINVKAISALRSEERCSIFFWVPQQAVDRTARALGI